MTGGTSTDGVLVALALLAAVGSAVASDLLRAWWRSTHDLRSLRRAQRVRTALRRTP